MAAANTGIGNAGLADRYIEATDRAQSRLAQIGAISRLTPGEEFGDDGGGFSWRLRISPPLIGAQQSGDARQPQPLGLYTVQVTISWRSGTSTRSVSLQSQRLARLGEDNG